MRSSKAFRDFVLDQLSGVPDVLARAMFGGSACTRDVFFGIIATDILYLKVDDSNRREYEAAGSRAFTRSRTGGGRRRGCPNTRSPSMSSRARTRSSRGRRPRFALPPGRSQPPGWLGGSRSQKGVFGPPINKTARPTLMADHDSDNHQRNSNEPSNARPSLRALEL